MLSIQALGQQNLAAIASVGGGGATAGGSPAAAAAGSGATAAGVGQDIASALYGMDGRMMKLQGELVTELFSALA